MGPRARKARSETKRSIRTLPLSAEARTLLETATYEGSPFHKKEPNDFGLTPPTAPRPDATLCDEAGVLRRDQAVPLFKLAIRRGLVSEQDAGLGFPKQIWVHDGEHVYELMYGGSRAGAYHGYPVRRSDPLYEAVRKAWGE